MNFRYKRLIYIRRIVFIFLIVLTALFQHSGFFPKVFSAPAMALVPLTVCLGMSERSTAGMWYGALAGILWDFASPVGDGFFSIALTAAGFFSGVLSAFVFRSNIRSALLVSFGVLTTVNVSYWLLFVLRKGYGDALGVLVSYYLPSVLYSLVFVFVYYYIIEFFVRLTREKKSF